MKSMTKKISSIQAAAKAIMNNSASTISGGDAGKQRRKGEKISKRMDALETTSTAFSDSDKYSSNERLDRKVEKEIISPADHPFIALDRSQDVEMEFDSDHSFDSPMGLEQESVHSKVASTYGTKLLQNLINKQTKLYGDFGKHEIESSHRKQMIIWMDEVLTIFRCPADTFFLASHIMDRYLEETSEFLKLKDLHEIGIVCMFISSKYQEVDPLTLDLMIAKVAHGKLSSKQLLDRERKIASCLRFRFQVPNVFHFLEAYLEIYSPKFLSDDSVLLEENMIKIAKKCILEKRKAFNTLPSILALYVLHKALRSVYELDKKNVLIKEFMNLIKNELSSDEDLRSNCTKGDKNFA